MFATCVSSHTYAYAFTHDHYFNWIGSLWGAKEQHFAPRSSRTPLLYNKGVKTSWLPTLYPKIAIYRSLVGPIIRAPTRTHITRHWCNVKQLNTCMCLAVFLVGPHLVQLSHVTRHRLTTARVVPLRSLLYNGAVVIHTYPWPGKVASLTMFENLSVNDLAVTTLLEDGGEKIKK